MKFKNHDVDQVHLPHFRRPWLVALYRCLCDATTIVIVNRVVKAIQILSETGEFAKPSFHLHAAAIHLVKVMKKPDRNGQFEGSLDNGPGVVHIFFKLTCSLTSCHFV